MTVGFTKRLALLLALLGFALVSHGCSGGSGTVGLSTGFDCAGSGSVDAKVLCLQSCNLGCSTTGCAQTNIAQNQIVILRFSEQVDPNSVNESSIRFRTAAEDEPVGEFFVNGEVVEFVPTLAISGGQTFFGFTSGETYTMTIIGGEDQPAVVRSLSGKPFGQQLTCTLASTNGIVDLNGQPPSATLISPVPQLSNSAPRDTEILLEFNELIDATPFLTGTQSPVEFSVRRTRPTGNGDFECNPDSDPLTLGGTQSLSFDAARGVSLLTFTPTQLLPGNVCIEINITDGVRDLSGRSAQPQVLRFRTVVVPLTEQEIVEEFDDDEMLDVDASAGTWGDLVGNDRVAKFFKIGGIGQHGPFSLSLASDTGIIEEGRRIYELNCDSTTIPAGNSLSNASVTITNGRFFFTEMVVPSSARLTFVGTNPPVITVAGRLDIQGDIVVNGKSILTQHTAALPNGQPGAEGGIFGGAGGAGGQKCPGNTPATAANFGQNGADANVLGGHGYLASTVDTGGRGSQVQPPSGLSSEQQFGSGTTPPSLEYCISTNSGGGGGGLYGPGQPGQVIGIFSGPTPIANPTPFIGPIAAGGVGMQLFPFPPATGLQRSSEHFLIGGSGGGGSGSACMLSLSILTARTWSSGAGGGGGGGAMALRCGGSLFVGPTARLQAKGGSASDFSGTTASAQVAPAGGGSGGSIVIQAGGSAAINGQIDVSGGEGGSFDRQGGTGVQPSGAIIRIKAGDGAPGFVRYERATTPQLTELAGMVPPASPDNVGMIRLADFDQVVSTRSLFYSTAQSCAVAAVGYRRYEIEALVDGVPMVFSDDPAVSALRATVGAPLRVLFQAAVIDPVTGQVGQRGPWRANVGTFAGQVGIASEGFNGFRFVLVRDRALANVVLVTKLTVVYSL